MYLALDKPYRCDNPHCPIGARAMVMERLIGLGLTFDHCGALVCLQYFAEKFSDEAKARIASQHAVAGQAAKEAQAAATKAAGLGPKAQGEAKQAQTAAQEAAQAAAEAVQSPAPGEAAARALAAAKRAAAALEAAIIKAANP